MKLFGRKLIQTATLATTVARAGMRPVGIDPQWSHIPALPAL